MDSHPAAIKGWDTPTFVSVLRVLARGETHAFDSERRDAKHIRRDNAILRRVHLDHTDDETVDARNNKTGPHLFSDQDRRDHGEKTG